MKETKVKYSLPSEGSSMDSVVDGVVLTAVVVNFCVVAVGVGVSVILAVGAVDVIVLAEVGIVVGRSVMVTHRKNINGLIRQRVSYCFK